MDIAVIGTGHVGLVTGACFADLGNKVICVDKNEETINNLNKGIVPFYEPGLKEIITKNTKNNRLAFTTDIKEAVLNSLIIFITVGTPTKYNGESNLVYVEKVTAQIAEIINSYRLIVEKSTVPVETGIWVKHTIKLKASKNVVFDVASNPEFLSEGNAINDFMKPDRIVIGVENEKSEKLLKELYTPLNAPIIVTDTNSAELIKHASNSFLATKISFINSVAEICEKTNADIEKVSKGMGLDSRIGKKFLKAGIGYGGSCFPKDVKAFIHIAKKKGFNFDILEAVSEVNKKCQENFLKKIKDNLWIIEDKNIAVWGLSFKPGTDDIREAPSISIIKKLLDEKAHIKAYDPQVSEKQFKNSIDGKIEFFDNIYDTINNSDCLLILTEWNDFKEVDLKKVKSLLNQPLIIDGRNIYDIEKMQNLGFTYISVGRPTVNKKVDYNNNQIFSTNNKENI